MFEISKNKKKNNKMSASMKKIWDDPILWLGNFCKVRNADKELVPFILHEQQKEFVHNIKRYNVISKPRQLGFSTISLGLILWSAVTMNNTRYAIFTHEKQSADSLFEDLKLMFDSLPKRAEHKEDTDAEDDKYAEFFPHAVRDNRDELKLSNGSRIICEPVGTADKGRGMNLQYILLSEYAFYEEEKQSKIITNMEQALAKNKDAKLVIETTSNGIGSYYFHLFRDSYENPKDSRYKAFFFPFYSSAYKQLYKFEHDEAREWLKLNLGRDLLITDLDDDEFKIYEKCNDMIFLIWRRWKLATGKSTDNLRKFHQEYPSHYMESFLATGDKFFNQNTIIDKYDYLEDEINDIENISDVLSSVLGKELFIYHLPVAGVKYFAGVDSASGNRRDLSTMTIIDEYGVQVASFYSNRFQPHDFADIVYELGMYFNCANLVIERNGGYGESVIEKLWKYHGYINIYKHKQFDKKGKKKKDRGWISTKLTKEMVLLNLRDQFEKDLIQINCKETLQHMSAYEAGASNQKDGHHCDLVVSSALAVEGLKYKHLYYADLNNLPTD